MNTDQINEAIDTPARKAVKDLNTKLRSINEEVLAFKQEVKEIPQKQKQLATDIDALKGHVRDLPQIVSDNIVDQIIHEVRSVKINLGSLESRDTTEVYKALAKALVSSERLFRSIFIFPLLLDITNNSIL